MLLTYNEKLRKNQWVLEESDLTEIYEVQKTMQTAGWKYLHKQWEACRDVLIDQIKNCPKSRTKIELTPMFASKLDGYDEFASIPLKLDAMLKEYMEDKVNEEVSN